MRKEAFLAAVKAAGIVGEGGAGFPAHVKYAVPDGGIDTVIANGCECEPLLRTDLHVMAHGGEAVLHGLAALAGAVGAGRAVLAVKKKHESLIKALSGPASELGIELFALEDFYPAGDEQILVREVTGRSVPPLGLPLAVRVVVANVGTLADVSAALGKGGAAPVPVTEKLLTVTGEVRRPAVLRAPIGAPLAECLEFCGGALPEDPVFLIGGPMMGRLAPGPAALAGEVVSKTTGGLIVLPAGHPLHINAAAPVEFMRRRAASACIQCRMCSDLCPRRLIGHPFETHRVMRAFAARSETRAPEGALASMCCECGVCEQYACPMRLSPRRINQAVKRSLRGADIRYQGTRGLAEAAVLLRDQRKIPLQRLAARIGVSAYMRLETPFAGELRTRRVSIPLRQHIGAAATPVVKEGDRVRAGDCIGEAPANVPGARVHASISGTVDAVADCVRISAC
jgi:Na+-translocating ferredoxin:NAD+ oxidoreductase RnfC subunit